MGHVHPDAFGLPAQFFRIGVPDVGPVDIPIDPAQGFESSQPLSERQRAEIAGMPDLVAIFEMPEDVFVQEMMGVG